MKKLFAFVLFTSFVCQLSAWTHFTIKNDTNKTVEFSTESVKTDLAAEESYKIVSYDVSTNPYMKFENRIVLGKNESWFKIGEKTPAQGRTFTIAPRIDIDPGKTTTIKVKDVLNILKHKKPLPEGFKYHKYAMGAREVAPTMVTSVIEKTLTPKFYIKNDTFYKTNVIACDSGDKLEIKPMIYQTLAKILPGGKFTVNPVLYKSYKPAEGMMFATRYRIVDEKNMFRLEIQIDETIHKFTIQITKNLEPETILKISSLIPHPDGFKIKSHETNIAK